MKAVLVGLALLPALIAVPLRAQQRPDSVRPATVLEPLVVTVLRTPVRLTRAPYAVSVNTRDEIARARPGLGLDEALRGIPGVQADNRYNYALGERISIRGFGARSQFGVRGIRVTVDGIPATFPDGQTSLSHVDPFFLGRAEVVRGPASALYGGSAGGVIQLETAPPPDAPLGEVLRLTGGANGLLDLQSRTGGRSGSDSYVLDLSHLNYDGYRDFNTARTSHLDARVVHAGRSGELRLMASAVRYDAENPGSLSERLLAQNRFQAYSNNVAQRTGERGEQGQLGATWRRRGGAGEWELTGYGIARSVDNPIPSDVVTLHRVVGGARALFRADPLGFAALRWTLGAEGALQRDDRRNFANEQGARGDVTLDQLEHVTDLAAFAQLLADPLPSLTLLGGLRYDWYRFGADDRLITPDDPDDSGSRTMRRLSPSVGVTYTIDEALNVYANAATAFETPTTTELTNRPSGAGGFNPELQPQTTVSYEVGAKGRVGALAYYALDAYRANVDNELISFQVPEAPGRDFYRNAGSAVHRGVEAEVGVTPVDGALLRASYTYTDARFRRYATAAAVYDGNRVPGVAPHQMELLASYTAPRGWYAAAEGRYDSSIPVNDANDAESPGHFVTDVRAGLGGVRLGGARLSPFLGATNVFDVEYNTSVVVNAFGGRYFEPGPARALYAGAELRL
ncbi:MAG TPA: TonB-dependent receptor [Longimicrobiaceae bacterium]|nr:TonB-dependent receptor [Longimicrobiaceae bacterium]